MEEVEHSRNPPSNTPTPADLNGSGSLKYLDKEKKPTIEGIVFPQIFTEQEVFDYLDLDKYKLSTPETVLRETKSSSIITARCQRKL